MCSILFKQMTLYYSLAIFAYYLGKIVQKANLINFKNLKLNLNGSSICLLLLNIVFYAFLVIFITVLAFLPWIENIN